MTEARPSDGFIVQLTSALVLMICTLLSLPISHSHVLVFAIIGLNMAQKKEIDYKTLKKILIFWIITFPVSALMASVTYYLFICIGFT
jgi:PiT family inorganic phosphate transporter